LLTISSTQYLIRKYLIKIIFYRDLSSNELTDTLQSEKIPVLHSLGHLVTLNLEGNRIQTISARLLSGLEKLVNLNLNENPVTTVESYAFSALPSLTEL